MAERLHGVRVEVTQRQASDALSAARVARSLGAHWVGRGAMCQCQLTLLRGLSQLLGCEAMRMAQRLVERRWRGAVLGERCIQPASRHQPQKRVS